MSKQDQLFAGKKHRLGGKALRFLIGLCVLAAVVPKLSAEVYTIKGELTGTTYSWTAAVVGTQTTRFIVKIEENRWLIKSEYTTNWFSLTGGDGTNTYNVLVDPNPKATDLPAPASVCYGDFPMDASYTVLVPWLAFCSSHFLKDPLNKESIPSLCQQAQIDPMSHVCSTEVALFSDPPNLPREIKWITNSKRIASASANNMLRVEGATVKELDERAVDFKKLVRAGELLGNYHVLNETNISGMVLPLEFELNAYGYLSDQQKDYSQRILDAASKTNSLLEDRKLENTYLAGTCIGKVDEISVDNDPVTLPDPEVPMSITDYRLSSRKKGIDFVSYHSKEWKPQVDAELLALLDAKKKNPPHHQSPSSLTGTRSHNILRAVVLIVFLVPLLVLGVRKLKTLK